jgi:hypothetical protein
MELIKAYLARNERLASVGVACTPPNEPVRSAKVVWLKDVSAARGPEKHRAVRFK